jgi:catechol 2,3-dioxygenase-like lactoylglutathione lyase family enzyme
LHIDRLDHLVLTVKDLETTVAFYTSVLGMGVQRLPAGRTALTFGQQKINLHQQGREFDPKAHRPTPGSGDVCLLTSVPIADVVRHLGACNVEIIEGPVQRAGAIGPILSVYFRDPDLNLIEVSNLIAG